MAQNAPKPGSGVNARKVTPSGLVRPKGFNKEWNTFNQAKQTGKITNSVSALGSGNGTSLPWDGIAEGQVATAANTHANSNAQIASNRALGLSEFGLDAGYNDYKANPYSQAAILQHNHESNERGINTTAGQALYSGQTGNAQAIDRGRTNQAHQGLENEENRAKANWVAEEKAAQQAEEEAINAAKEGAVGRAVENNHPEVPLNEGGQQKEKIPYPAPPKKKWAWNGSHWHLVKA